MMPPRSQLNIEQLPISITLENNPKNGILSVHYSGFDEFKPFSQHCEFASFPTSGGLKVYFAGNDPGQSFVVDSFDVEATVTTPAPVYVPPTKMPTSDPTIKPSATASIKPITVTPQPTPNPVINQDIVHNVTPQPT